MRASRDRVYVSARCCRSEESLRISMLELLSRALQSWFVWRMYFQEETQASVRRQSVFAWSMSLSDKRTDNGWLRIRASSDK